MTRVYNINNMSGLGKTLLDLLIPSTNSYWGSLVFEAEIVEDNKVLKVRLDTIYRDWDYDKKYIKSHSQMNISELRKSIKEALGLGPKDLIFYHMSGVDHSDYNHTYTREACLEYKITDELVDKLIALEAMTSKGLIHI